MERSKYLMEIMERHTARGAFSFCTEHGTGEHHIQKHRDGHLYLQPGFYAKQILCGFKIRWIYH
jgi:hypothetical protein